MSSIKWILFDRKKVRCRLRESGQQVKEDTSAKNQKL